MGAALPALTCSPSTQPRVMLRQGFKDRPFVHWSRVQDFCEEELRGLASPRPAPPAAPSPAPRTPRTRAAAAAAASSGDLTPAEAHGLLRGEGAREGLAGVRFASPEGERAGERADVGGAAGAESGEKELKPVKEVKPKPVKGVKSGASGGSGVDSRTDMAGRSEGKEGEGVRGG
jgi:hypothetical protein